MDINALSASEISDIIDKKIGLFFGACSVAYRVVENEYFLDLINTCLMIEPGKLNYKGLSRQTLSKTVIPTVLSDLDVKKKKLLENTGCVLKTDGWKNSSNNKKFLTFTLRNIHTNQVFLTFYDTSAETEDGKTLAGHIVNAVKLATEKYNCVVESIINDNDKKIKAGARIASDMLMQQKIIREPLIQVTCYSHSANLLVKSIYENDLILVEMRDVVHAFSSPKMAALVYTYGGCKLKNYPDTRFGYVRLTAETIYNSLDALKIIVELPNYMNSIDPKVVALIKSLEFERKLHEVIRTLTPICTLINHCQDPKVNLAEGTQQWLSLKLHTDIYDQKIQERISEAITGAGYAANLMHHQFKGEWLDEDQVKCAINYMNSRLNEAGKKELETFLEKRHEDDEIAKSYTNSIAYWSWRELAHPNLGKLCKQLMIIPASTALLEGFFSQWTYVHNKYRNRLSNESTGTLIDLYHLSKHLDGEFWINTVSKRKRTRIDLDDD